MLLTYTLLKMPQLFLSGQSKYLGVLLTSDLRCNSHIDNICQKSKRLLGMLHRKFYRVGNGMFLCHLYMEQG